VIERIAELVKEKKLEGISELRDESDKDGMRIAIDLKRGENADVIVNNLFLQTPLETSYSINMVALDNGQPKLMNLLDLVSAFIRHRQEVVTRRTLFELRKARERGHLLEGLTVALANIDGIIEAIKTSANSAEARERLLGGQWQSGGVLALLEKAGSVSVRPDVIDGEDPKHPFGLNADAYRLSPAQVSAILELRLHRLTGLEQDKLQGEYSEILAQIAELQSILDSFDKLMDVIRAELQAVLAQYGDERRTQIVESRIDFTREDLIPEEQVVLTVSKTGYAKTQPLEDYAAQRRGGRGKSATSMKEDDYIEHLVVASNHATVLCFTTRGKVYWLKTYDVPQASRGSKGRPLVNLLPLEENEGVTAILPLREYPDNHFVFMATASGTVKRVDLEQFSRPRSVGLIAIDLNDDDTLIGVAITDGEQQIMLFSNQGKAIRFPETEVRSMGRTAQGVRGMRIDDNSRIVSLVVAPEDGEVLTACANGYGKRTPVDDFPTRHRGGQGVIAVQTSDRNGELVRATAVNDDNEMLLISDGGTMVRTRVKEVRSTGRNAQGVMLIRLDVKEVLVGVVCIDCVGDDEDESDLDVIDADGAEVSVDDQAINVTDETEQAQTSDTPASDNND
jgi:DNA gyrase subunit A